MTLDIYVFFCMWCKLVASTPGNLWIIWNRTPHFWNSILLQISILTQYLFRPIWTIGLWRTRFEYVSCRIFFCHLTSSNIFMLRLYLVSLYKLQIHGTHISYRSSFIYICTRGGLLYHAWSLRYTNLISHNLQNTVNTSSWRFIPNTIGLDLLWIDCPHS